MRRATRWFVYILAFGVVFIVVKGLFVERMDNPLLRLSQAQCDTVKNAGKTLPAGCKGGSGSITADQCKAIKDANLPDAMPQGCS